MVSRYEYTPLVRLIRYFMSEMLVNGTKRYVRTMDTQQAIPTEEHESNSGHFCPSD